MKTTYRIICAVCLAFCFMSCSDFLDEQVPQATLTQDEVKKPEYIDNVLISAYAGLLSIEDMNSSFSLWNYDTRSDDAYVGGSNPSDGEAFHILEKHTTVMTTDWPIVSTNISRASACRSTSWLLPTRRTPPSSSVLQR